MEGYDEIQNQFVNNNLYDTNDLQYWGPICDKV